jgi:tetratricopeptide (TPR) repeat protein
MTAGLVWMALAAVSPAAEKAEKWIEVRSAHFVLLSNAEENQARHAAAEFEQFREVFRAAMPQARVDSGTPLVILAAKDEKSLKQLLPSYWERKGGARPVGCFVGGQEKEYVALRLDAPAGNRNRVIYHELAHKLVSLNYGVVPLWLNEGLAEFFAQAKLEGRDAGIGRPSEEQLRFLRRGKLLPLETLMAVDFQSPYYNESDKTSLFYAQSWALTHYLKMGERGANQEQVTYYLRLLSDGVAQPAAATRSFGDLNALGRKLEAYVQGNEFYVIRVPAGTTPDEAAFAARQITLAEVLAVRGDFHVHNNRLGEAQKELEEALRLDPKLALANEGMGFLQLKKGSRESAEQWFAKAVEFDSKNALAHYYHAVAMAREGEEVGDLEKTEKHLKRAIELNPDFAAAYSLLALAYATQGNQLDVALRLARQAVALVPGDIQYQLNLGHVLLRTERVDEATKAGQLALASARKAEDRTAAEQFLENVRKFQEFLMERKKYEERVAAEQKALDERRIQRQQGGKTVVGSRRGGGAEPVGPANSALEGKVAGVVCGETTALDLLVEHGKQMTKLHTENYFKVEFWAVNWQPPENFQPCDQLAGLRVKVIYRVTQGQPYAGEILTIEVKK